MQRLLRRAEPGAKAGRNPVHDPGGSRYQRDRLGLVTPSGAPARVLLLAISGAVQLCVSGNVYAEYEEVIRRPRLRQTETVITSALDTIREKGYWVRPVETIRACSDPDDDIFLECATAAQADCLVTGNIRHFPSSWMKTRIVTPRLFLDFLSGDTAPDQT
jgi:putative PIN family toxin of toxin-antitoxin system